MRQGGLISCRLFAGKHRFVYKTFTG